jgi:heptosyltransferase-2
MHIAGAFKIPTVAVFGSTNSIQTCQWNNPKSKIVRIDIECAPCMKRVCPLGHHKCMRDIKAENVIDAAKKLL